MLVTPQGGRWWRLKYRFQGKEKLLSLGTYPDVSLKVARQRRDEARSLLASGVDPSAERKRRNRIGQEQSADSFEAIAREWLGKFAPNFASGYRDDVIQRLEKDVFPEIGAIPMRTLTAPDVLRVLRRIEARGALETAHRIRQKVSQVARYAIATQRADRDPAADLKGALPPRQIKHHAAITDDEGRLAELLRAIEDYDGTMVVRCALRLAPLVFVRPSELAGALWAEIDLDAGRWIIAAARMKRRRDHIVPLATQAVAIFREIQPLTGQRELVFPSVRSPRRPMSNGTLNAALRRMGFDRDEMTTHGFRAIASTRLHEQGWNPEVIERQLAHVEKSKVKAAYQRGEYMDDRIRMMQAWADWLQGLRERCV